MLSQIQRLVAPVHKVRTLRSGCHLLPVDEKTVAIISRDVNDKLFKRAFQSQNPPEVKNTISVSWYVRVKNPEGCRRPVEDTWHF